jgi:uncharacterized membrane protein YhfC
MVTFFVSFGTFEIPLTVVCSFLAPTLFSCLYAYSDATWGIDPLNFNSISAYCVFLGPSLVSWKTKKQTTVAHSSAETELRALACVTAKVTWLRWLLADFGIPLITSTLVHNIVQDPVKHQTH